MFAGFCNAVLGAANVLCGGYWEVSAVSFVAAGLCLAGARRRG